jgi:Fe-S cluster biogenesis protein NfuA
MSDSEKQDWISRVDIALNDIRPHLAVDGGNIEVMNITDELIIQVKWLGNCEMCTMSSMTMKAGVEQAIKSRIPQINGVEALNGL